MLNVDSRWLDAASSATMRLESRPPESRTPTGTSATIRRSTAARSSASTSSAHSAAGADAGAEAAAPRAEAAAPGAKAAAPGAEAEVYAGVAAGRVKDGIQYTWSLLLPSTSTVRTVAGGSFRTPVRIVRGAGTTECQDR